MAKLTRRALIKQASVGAAAVGALTVLPGAAAAHAVERHAAPDLTGAEATGPIVAHVRNLASGEVAIYVGTREIVVHDRALVARLAQALR